MSTNKDQLTSNGQGNPTGSAQPIGAEERKKAFVDDIIKVYEEHDLSIAHEDSHGAFIIEDLDQYNIDWLRHALR